MPQKSQINELMNSHNCSRTKANNMLRKRGNGLVVNGEKKTKRRSIPKN